MYVVLIFVVVVVVVVGRGYRSVAGVGVGTARWRPRQLRTAATALCVATIRPWGAAGDRAQEAEGGGGCGGGHRHAESDRAFGGAGKNPACTSGRPR